MTLQEKIERNREILANGGTIDPETPDEEMPTSYVKKETGVEYILQGDFYLPNFGNEEDEEELPTYGRFGRMRLDFLQKKKDGRYTGMWLSGELDDHLATIDRQANEMLDRLVEQMAAAEGVNEDLKANDQMKWVGLMNNIRHSAEEIVLSELIYV